MKEFISSITGKGQVTIPVDVRRSLGVSPLDKVAFVLTETGTVELRPVRYTVAALKSVIPALPGRETDDFEDQIAEAFAAGAKRLAAESEHE